MTTYKAVNIIPLKYMLIRQVQFLQVQWNQHFLIADMFILIKPTLLFIDILVNISSLLILYIKPWYQEKPCIREKGTQIIIHYPRYLHSLRNFEIVIMVESAVDPIYCTDKWPKYKDGVNKRNFSACWNFYNRSVYLLL